jgi:hypothetical protein
MAYLFTLPKTRALSNSVLVIPGSRLYFYETGTSNQKNTYVDRDLNTPHTNPVISDEFGTFPVIWLDTATGFYRVVQTDNLGITVMSPIDEIGDDPVIQDTQASIGELLFRRTEAEIDAGVTPTLFSVPSHEALGGMVLPERYGFTGAVSATDTTAFANALLVADQINTFVGLSKAFTAVSQLTWPANVGLVGSGRATSVITKGFNGDLFASFPTGAWMQDIGLAGAGATFTGRLLPCLGSEGKQSAMRCDIVDAADYCIEFETSSGSQSCFEQCRIARYLGTTSDAFCSVKIPDTQQLSAKPRKFIGCETDGTYFIDFGGSNNTYVEACFSGGYKFHEESRAVFINGGRWANQTTCTVRGHQIVINAGDVLAALTLEGSGPITVGPTNFTGLTTDNGTAGQNLVYHSSVAYTPSLASGGTAPALGDGTLTGRYTRNGAIIIATINFSFGTTTTLGTGALRFGLPMTRYNGNIVCGNGAIMNDSGTLYNAECQIPGAVAYVELIRDTSGSVTFNSPATWATGDTIRMTVTYEI